MAFQDHFSTIQHPHCFVEQLQKAFMIVLTMMTEVSTLILPLMTRKSSDHYQSK